MATPPVVLVVYAWLIGYRGGGGRTLFTSNQHRQDAINVIDIKERSQHIERNKQDVLFSIANSLKNLELTHS